MLPTSGCFLLIAIKRDLKCILPILVYQYYLLIITFRIWSFLLHLLQTSLVLQHAPPNFNNSTGKLSHDPLLLRLINLAA